MKHNVHVNGNIDSVPDIIMHMYIILSIQFVMIPKSILKNKSGP